MDDLALLRDLLGNSEETKLLICTIILFGGLVITVLAKRRVDLRAKIGHYRNTCLVSNIIKTKYPVQIK